MSKPKYDVAIAGEINLDLILYGLPAVMPLEREILASGFVPTLGSSSAIVAHNLATLGTSVGFICMAGQDEFGRIALERLSASGVDTQESLHHPTLNTGITVLLPHGDERHILTYLGAMEELTVAHLPMDYIRSARHFHLSSLYLQKGLQAGLPDLFRSLKKDGITISLDTNDDPDDKWAGGLDELLDLIDVLLPNEDELKRMTGEATLEAALDSLRSRVPIIAVKCGARGAVVQTNTFREQVPGITVQPVDTIGAGDSFDAGFLHAWLSGADPVEAARLGNITGALSTQRPGGTESFRDPALVQQFLAAHRPAPTAR